MLLVLFFVFASLLIVLFSSIKIDVEHLYFCKKEGEKQTLSYDLSIGMYFLNKIPYLKIKVNSNKRKKMFFHDVLEIVKRIGIITKKEKSGKKNLKTEFAATGEIFHTVKKLKANIEKIEIAVNVLFLDMMLTTYLVPTIATILAILFANIIKGFDKKKHKYEIKPAYQEKSILEVKLNCIISVKIVHIIHVINYFWKEKRRVKKNERTSHRSTYANGYG